MTRIGRLLETETWVHALGELCLIVAGILIALWINDWHDRRKDREAELNILRDMHASLVEDTADFAHGVRAFTRHRAAIDTIQQVIATKAPYRPQLDSLFGRCYWIAFKASLRPAVYDLLKSRGFELIENDRLRKAISEYYGDTYEDVRSENESNASAAFDVMRPYFLAHFRKLRPGRSATPLNYSALIADPYFDNMLEYRNNNARNHLVAYDSAFAHAARILKSIEKELNR